MRRKNERFHSANGGAFGSVGFLRNAAAGGPTASLLSSLSALLPTAAEPSRETFAFFQQGEGNEPAERLALQSAAREAEAFLVRLAGKAGYDAQGKVWLDMDGALFQAEVMLSPREGQSLLLTADQLRQKIAQTLQVEESRITVVQSSEAEGT